MRVAERQQLQGSINQAAEDQAELDKTAALQNKLEERTKDLVNKLERMGQERKDKDPATAEALQEGAKRGRDQGVAEQMKNAGEHLQGNTELLARLGRLVAIPRPLARQRESVFAGT